MPSIETQTQKLTPTGKNYREIAKKISDFIEKHNVSVAELAYATDAVSAELICDDKHYEYAVEGHYASISYGYCPESFDALFSAIKEAGEEQSLGGFSGSEFYNMETKYLRLQEDLRELYDEGHVCAALASIDLSKFSYAQCPEIEEAIQKVYAEDLAPDPEPPRIEVKEVTLLTPEEFRMLPREKDIQLNKDWWLRPSEIQAPSKESFYTPVVKDSPNWLVVEDAGIMDVKQVRPALKVSDLGKGSYKIGDEVMVPEKGIDTAYIVVSNDTLLRKESIGNHEYSRDTRRYHADHLENDYDHSDIKRFLDGWAKDMDLIVAGPNRIVDIPQENTGRNEHNPEKTHDGLEIAVIPVNILHPEYGHIYHARDEKNQCVSFSIDQETDTGNIHYSLSFTSGALNQRYDGFMLHEDMPDITILDDQAVFLQMARRIFKADETLDLSDWINDGKSILKNEVAHAKEMSETDHLLDGVFDKEPIPFDAHEDTEPDLSECVEGTYAEGYDPGDD